MENYIATLQKNMNTLVEKHNQSIQNNEFGMALNIMKNIEQITRCLRDIDYRTVVSKFKIEENGETKELLSIWKQREAGEIKDVETYVIKEKYNGGFYNTIKSLSENWCKFSDEEKSEVFKLMGVASK